MSARKQSGDEVASLAACLMAEFSRGRSKAVVVYRRELLALCASVLSQDETHGPRRRKKARK